METLVLFLIAFGSFGLLFIVRKWFITKRYPQKTGEMLTSIASIENYCLKRDTYGYSGYYKEYFINLYATTSIKSYGHMQGDLFQVWVYVAPEEGQLKGLGGFFGKYLVSQPQPKYAMIGFTKHYYSSSDNTSEIISMLDELIEKLREKNVQAYKF